MPLRLTTAGESHGPGLTCIIEGFPAGLELHRDAQTLEDVFRADLAAFRAQSTELAPRYR